MDDLDFEEFKKEQGTWSWYWIVSRHDRVFSCINIAAIGYPE